MSKFYCDSNCEIWFSRLDELGIECIRMPYTVNGEERFYDLGRNTDNRAFFADMRNKASVKTQALNEHDYIEYFEPTLRAGEDILYVHFSREMSSTFVGMEKAIDTLREKYPDRKITTVDTRNISMGSGMVTYFAAKMHNDGASDEEVAAFVRSFREKVQVYFTVDDLVYLKRGGRLSAVKAAIGTILNLKPIISTSKEGKLVNIVNAKGRKKALRMLLEYMESGKVDTSYPISIMNADSDADTALFIEMIREQYPQAEIWEQLVGPVVGCHCGPDTIGLIFVSKQD
ncbi:MAG: DegV family protein [Clostridia bacterium]|nr:DegV family protein [Clostridia bacterium]